MGLPARAAAPVLVAMFPGAAARVLGAMADQPALDLLSAAGVQGAVSVLRHIAEPRRSRLIEGLSTATAVAARMLLGYPEDSVGAWADPQAVALPPGMSAEQALAQVRGEAEGEAGTIFVVDESQRLLGCVELAALLRAPDWSTLGALMSPPVATLPAVMPLGGALGHRAWRRTSLLPVVELGDRLLGILRLSAIAGVAGRGTGGEAGADLTLAEFAARGYWDAVSGLVRTCLLLIPPSKQVVEDKG